MNQMKERRNKTSFAFTVNKELKTFDLARQRDRTMNVTKAHKIIDRLLHDTMLGYSEFNPTLLLVTRAILTHVENPSMIWKIYEVASESTSNQDIITRKRQALLEGRPILCESTFDVTKDTWKCCLALETTNIRGRSIAVEIIEPYSFNDCGYILNINILKTSLISLDKNTRSWIADLGKFNDCPNSSLFLPNNL
jgi:hypothetical protein